MAEARQLARQPPARVSSFFLKKKGFRCFGHPSCLTELLCLHERYLLWNFGFVIPKVLGLDTNITLLVSNENCIYFLS